MKTLSYVGYPLDHKYTYLSSSVLIALVKIVKNHKTLALR